MNQVDQALAVVTFWIRMTLGVFLSLFSVIERWVDGWLSQVGITGEAQRWVMVAVTVLFIVVVVRVFGGFFRVMLMVFLFLLLLDLMMPLMQSLPQ